MTWETYSYAFICAVDLHLSSYAFQTFSCVWYLLMNHIHASFLFATVTSMFTRVTCLYFLHASTYYMPFTCYTPLLVTCLYFVHASICLMPYLLYVFTCFMSYSLMLCWIMCLLYCSRVNVLLKSLMVYMSETSLWILDCLSHLGHIDLSLMNYHICPLLWYTISLAILGCLLGVTIWIGMLGLVHTTQYVMMRIGFLSQH